MFGVTWRCEPLVRAAVLSQVGVHFHQETPIGRPRCRAPPGNKTPDLPNKGLKACSELYLAMTALLFTVQKK